MSARDFGLLTLLTKELLTDGATDQRATDGETERQQERI